MTQLMFYERPVPLNRDRHQHLKLSVAPGHFKFAGQTNAVPVVATEFADVARNYPIVFVGDTTGPITVAALVGLRQDENLMIDAQGQWAAGTYIPAFARRYPFVLAKTEQGDKFTVCIDEVYPGLGSDQGELLFEASGQESDYLKRILDFLQRFHADAERTTAFAERLRTLGLLVPKTIQVDVQGQVQTLQGVWVVDEARYRNIDDARVVELFRQGHVAWIEAHLLSLGSLSQLAVRMGPQTQVAEDGQPIPGENPLPTDVVKH